MIIIKLMYVKFYCVWVIDVKFDYVGSVIIDLDLFEKVGILFLEEV